MSNPIPETVSGATYFVIHYQETMNGSWLLICRCFGKAEFRDSSYIQENPFVSFTFTPVQPALSAYMDNLLLRLVEVLHNG